MAYVFLSFTSVFSYLCSKKNHTARHKYVKGQREDFRPRCDSLTAAVKISHTRAKHIM